MSFEKYNVKSLLSLSLLLLKQKDRCPEIKSKEKVSPFTFVVCKEFHLLKGHFILFNFKNPPPAPLQKKASGHTPKY